MSDAARTSKGNLHEDLARGEPVPAGSERGFAIVFCAFFGLVGAYQAWKGAAHAGWWFVAAAAILVVGLVRPSLLAPANRAWTRLGLLLGRVMNPVILALMFFAVITPIGLLMRALGKRPIPLAPDPTRASYWIRRDPPGPDGGSMTNQF